MDGFCFVHTMPISENLNLALCTVTKFYFKTSAFLENRKNNTEISPLEKNKNILVENSI